MEYKDSYEILGLKKEASQDEIKRACCTMGSCLRQDLGINLLGVALSLDLLDEIEGLKRELNQLRHFTQTQLAD